MTAVAAAVVNANPRGDATITVMTERTKLRKNTRNISHTNTAEAHDCTATTHCSYDRHKKGKWAETDAVTDFQQLLMFPPKLLRLETLLILVRLSLRMNIPLLLCQVNSIFHLDTLNQDCFFPNTVFSD